MPDRARPPSEQTVPHILLGAGKLTFKIIFVHPLLLDVQFKPKGVDRDRRPLHFHRDELGAGELSFSFLVTFWSKLSCTFTKIFTFFTFSMRYQWNNWC